MGAKKKLKEYLSKGVRKLKHRKGFGVHSPFAYSIITEVIEEKLPYYAYRRMQRTYTKQAPVSFKVACLVLRLANRFRCRHAVEIVSDGGYTLLPLVLSDSRLRVTALTDPVAVGAGVTVGAGVSAGSAASSERHCASVAIFVMTVPAPAA